jgi:thioredoxin 1
MSNVIEVNEANFKEEVLESKTPVLIDFFAEWCGPCKMMSPVLDQIATKMNSKLKVVKLDTDKSQALAIEYKISGIPCLVLMKEGKEATRLVGFQSEDALISKLESSL